MIESDYCVRFLLKPFQALRIAGKARGQEFERRVSARGNVRSEIYLAHSAGADKRLDPVMTNQFSNQCAGAGPVISQKLRSNFKGWKFDKILCSIVTGDQRLHLAAQGFIAIASFIDKRRPLLRRAFGRRLEKIVDLLPTLRIHQGSFPLSA